MLTVGIIGVGNAGSQIAAYALKEEQFDVVVMNASENDLATLPEDVIKFKLGDAKGSGKNRDEAKRFLKDSIKGILEKKEFVDFMDNKDVIFVVSSTGGGTGSGIAPIMSSILKKTFPQTYVILVGILPTLDEAYSTQINSLDYMQELYRKLENPTYMIYDNDKLRNLPSHQMMEEINKSIVEDIKVIRGTYNYPTKYSSIDEKDMSMIISTPGRIVVAGYQNMKEKDLDVMSVDAKIESILKSGTHAELQLDHILKRSGVIANLSDSLSKNFDEHLLELQKFVGAPVEEFTHISINSDKSLPNNVFFIGAGMSFVNDRIAKINERVQEIDAMQSETAENDDDIFAIDVHKANEKRNYQDRSSKAPVDVASIFDDFMNM